VLSLDALRAVGDGQSLAALQRKVERCVQAARETSLTEAGLVAKAAVSHAESWLQRTLPLGSDALEVGARRFALTLGRALALALLVEHGQWSLDHEQDSRAMAAARRFARQPVDSVVDVLASDAFALASG
jgi:hypothetical protein